MKATQVSAGYVITNCGYRGSHSYFSQANILRQYTTVCHMMMVVWPKHVVAMTLEEERKNCCVGGPLLALRRFRLLLMSMEIQEWDYWAMHRHEEIRNICIIFTWNLLLEAGLKLLKKVRGYKVNLSLYLTKHHALKTFGSGCVNLGLLDLGTSWRWVVSLTSLALNLEPLVSIG
jgi:hypothetical protein